MHCFFQKTFARFFETIEFVQASKSCSFLKGLFFSFFATLTTKVERSEFCTRVLESRMREGTLGAAKIWPDVTTYVAQGDVLASAESLLAGFPCQAGSFALYFKVKTST